MTELRNVSTTFDDARTYAVRNLSLLVHARETLVLIGSSGCGKTTTLKMVNRLLEPTSGRVIVNGCDFT